MTKNNKRIPILYVNATPEHGGSNIQLIEILKKLDLKKYRPIIVNPSQDVKREADFSPFSNEIYTYKLGVLKRSLNPLRLFKFVIETFQGIRRLRKLIKDNDIRLVHSNSIEVISGAIAAKLLGIPSVWHIHEYVTPRWIQAIMVRIVSHFSDRIIAISKTVSEQFPESAQKKIEIIYDGIDVAEMKPGTKIARARVRSAMALPSDATVIGMMGRFVPWKGQEYFIRACPDILKEVPDAHFVIAGQTFDELSGYVDYLHELSSNLGLLKSLHFEYWCKDSREMMDIMDVFVHASIKPEPFGLVVIEAMALEKPVVGTIGGVREIINKDVGLTVPPCDHGAISDSVIRILKSDEFINMGKRGRDRVVKNFNSLSTAKKFTTIYENYTEDKI